MNEVVERVALAIYAALKKDGNYVGKFGSTEFSKTETTLDGDFDLFATARAAIAAMREPTEAMKLAPPDVNFSPMDAEHAWHAMIEAALGKIDA